MIKPAVFTQSFTPSLRLSVCTFSKQVDFVESSFSFYSASLRLSLCTFPKQVGFVEFGLSHFFFVFLPCGPEIDAVSCWCS